MAYRKYASRPSMSTSTKFDVYGDYELTTQHSHYKLYEKDLTLQDLRSEIKKFFPKAVHQPQYWALLCTRILKGLESNGIDVKVDIDSSGAQVIFKKRKGEWVQLVKKPPSNTLYEMLGVRPNATKKDMTVAYRKKALEYHPDKHPQDQQLYTALMQQVNRAYNILSDTTKRREYDSQLLLTEKETEISRAFEDVEDIETPLKKVIENVCFHTLNIKWNRKQVGMQSLGNARLSYKNLPSYSYVRSLIHSTMRPTQRNCNKLIRELDEQISKYSKSNCSQRPVILDELEERKLYVTRVMCNELKSRTSRR